MNTLTIIDTSPLLYSTCYTCNKEDEPRRNDFSHYTEIFDSYMTSILEETDANYFLAFGDGYTSFRKNTFSNFKGDRKKPYTKFMLDLKLHAEKKWNIISSNILESDDLCVIHSNFYNKYNFNDSNNMIIATIDSDLRQEKGKFFNFGYRRKNIPVEEAFETVTYEQSIINLWSQVLSKGHNNKSDYLANCGEKCAEKYLKNFSINQLKLATLNAFIQGIDKKRYNVPRNIKGYGLALGIEKFSRAFKQTYLLRTEEEATREDPNFTLSTPTKIIEIDQFNDDTLIL